MAVLTVLFAWRTEFRDPGVLDLFEDFTSIKVQDEYNSFTSDDLKYTQTDFVYKRAGIYQGRHCSTCKIQKPPKASHCRVCNNCVRGFDQ